MNCACSWCFIQYCVVVLKYGCEYNRNSDELRRACASVLVFLFRVQKWWTILPQKVPKFSHGQRIVRSDGAAGPISLLSLIMRSPVIVFMLEF
jgi:hypothetical protein